MRLLLPEDILRRAESHESFQYITVPPCRIFHKRIQFAVRECPGAAFPELYVRLRIKHSCLPEFLHISFAFPYRCSSLNDKRMVSLAGKKISAEQARGAAPDDHRSVRQSFRAVFRHTVRTAGYFPDVSLHAFQYTLFVLYLCVDRVYIIKFRFLPGIKRTLTDVVLS